ncbi:hypothetical protein PsorP6_005557 [Peronosclerospora sorghi]|uniref:Uncharacterized protein n=1 Tax=Peronosclerospora sorghi TaxID=230839 RepID=A0ACC0W4E6_9STRA|nr:hypothetical protein PsorP6_005557 [Peronosclerospora sorghi]
MDAHDEFQTQRLVPLIVETDLSAHVLESRAQLACFELFRSRGLLDFALFDTHDFLHGSAAKRKTLDLLLAKRTWHVGTDGPVVLIGNYFFDSFPVDVFPVVREDEDRVVVYEALVEQETLRLADLDLVLSPVREASTQSKYQDSRVNATLRQVLDDFQSTYEMSGHILFPVDAIALFLTFSIPPTRPLHFPSLSLPVMPSIRFEMQFPALSSTGRTRLRVSISHNYLLIPLLFDLVDRTSLIYSGRSHLVTAPANDTLYVFYAILEPQSPPSTKSNTTIVASFAHLFARLTASDYDLVWGMMSCDDAASCFSIDALLGLLAQSMWDFDLFAVVMWELLRRRRFQATNATSALYRNLLIEAGSKSWRTFFPMENTVHLLHRLQVARWFYALEAYENVLELFTCWQDHILPSITSNEEAVYYLLGLTSFRNKQP